MKKLSFLCVMAAGMLAIQSCGDNNNKESVGAASDTTNNMTNDATYARHHDMTPERNSYFFT